MTDAFENTNNNELDALHNAHYNAAVQVERKNESLRVMPLPGQERFVADVEKTALQEVDMVDQNATSASMWKDAWRALRKNPLFIISGILIIFILFVAIFPMVFTRVDPNYCVIDNSLGDPKLGHILGFDLQGCDIFARVVYGTRTSIAVGLFSTIFVIALGSFVGALAGFFGGWVDSLLSRLTDIFLALPMLLGAIVVLQMFKTNHSIWKIIFVVTLFGWAGAARIARGAVLSAKHLEFNVASTALGSTPWRNLFRHIIPNSLAPIIVIATTSLGSYIVLEATLSFFGLGLPTTTVSWGGDIASAQTSLQTNPMVLFYPSLALAVTVLAFIMMGDAVKDALDPKSRTR